MFIFLYTVFRNSSISDEHVFFVALHFTTGLHNKTPQKLDFFCLTFGVQFKSGGYCFCWKTPCLKLPS
ncbi:hypothetical protein B7726_00265 [Streptococcus oralis subsp. tigurinus]|nr:hypothetical protein B7726_00265 [Streptococcus oralis subsp. tigurinus]